MRLRYLQSGGNNPEILMHIAGMEKDAIALAQKNGDVSAKRRKDLGKSCAHFYYHGSICGKYTYIFTFGDNVVLLCRQNKRWK